MMEVAQLVSVNKLDFIIECLPKCGKCSGSNNICTSCSLGYRTSITPTCGCLNGYFDDYVNTACQKCAT